MLVLMHFAYLLLQMPQAGQVVRLTRAENVPGYPALLCQALSSQGMPWYPEYRVYEEYRDYEQGQFFCEVRILNFERKVQHIAGGIGLTVEQSVQEAAYHAITRYRYECPYLAEEDSPFYYFPSAVEGEEGVYRSVYMSASDQANPTVRLLVEMLNATDHRAHLWREYAIAGRMSQWDMLMDIEPYVQNGTLPQSFLCPSSTVLANYMAPPCVGGTIPPRGPRRTPPVVRGIRQSPYGRQPASAYRFSTPPVPLPF